MLVADASCLYEVVADTASAEAVRARLSIDTDRHLALAEVLDATLVTIDRRLAAAAGPRCDIEVIDAGR